MQTRRIAAGLVAVSLAGGAAVAATAPASAAGVKGKNTVTFNKATATALQNEGIEVKAVAPAKLSGPTSIVFPAKQTKPYLIKHTGGLTFARADASLTLTKFVFNINTDTVNVTVPGVGVVKGALDLGDTKVKRKKITAKLNVGFGQAAVLNAALQTTIFKDGMTLGKSVITFKG